jgi:hypothetical protein
MRRALVPCGTRSESAGHQVLVRRTPHRTRCFLLAPVCRALRAATPVVGFVIGQQRPPALDEPRQLRTRYSEQGSRVRAGCQLGKGIEPFAHRVAQYLSQYLVHSNRHSLSCLITACRGAVRQGPTPSADGTATWPGSPTSTSESRSASTVGNRHTPMCPVLLRERQRDCCCPRKRSTSETDPAERPSAPESPAKAAAWPEGARFLVPTGFPFLSVLARLPMTRLERVRAVG